MALAPPEHVLGFEYSLLTQVQSHCALDQLATIPEDDSMDEGVSLKRVISDALLPKYNDLPPNSAPRRMRNGGTPYLYPSVLHCWSRCWVKGFVFASSFMMLAHVLSEPVALLTGEPVSRPSHKDHIKNGLFFGSFVALYNTLLFASFKEPRKRQEWTGVMAFIAGWSILLAPPKGRYFAAIITFLRAVEIMARRRLGHISTLRKSGGLMFMCTVCSQILHTWVLNPSLLDPRFLRFLQQMTGADTFSSKQASIRSAIKQRILAPLKNGVAVYGPMYISSFLFFRAFRVPVSRLPKEVLVLGLNALRSMTFLVVIGWCSDYFSRYSSALRGFYNLRTSEGNIIIPLAHGEGLRNVGTALVLGCAAGFSSLVEKPSKRLELALYIASHSLHSIVKSVGLHRFMKLGRILQALIFSWSASIIFQAYANEESTLRPTYVFFFRYFFDGKSKRHRSLFHRFSPNVKLRS